MKFEKEISPSQLNSDDRKVNLKITMENNAAKKVFNNNSEIKVALPTLIDNVGANIAASIKCGTDKKLTGAASLALHLQNKYSFGAEVTGDLKTKKADGVTVVATGAIDDLRTGWL